LEKKKKPGEQPIMKEREGRQDQPGCLGGREKQRSHEISKNRERGRDPPLKKRGSRILKEKVGKSPKSTVFA